ncbi:MAG TPA: hypothetical protein DCY88_18635, partial [Cyanobacteria bacterium UBA11372]|nr:hypothetical protein [Cyanobacteria bacterium UBA11372]
MIAEIDGVLNQSGGFGLGWLNSRETAQQRRVLELVRSNLVSLDQQLVRAAAFEPKPNQSSQEANPPAQLQQARSEIATLRQQRQALMQEIEQLEQQRQNYLSQPQQSPQNQQAIAEFFQALMGNLQETLTPQLVQTLSHLETEFLTAKSPEPPSSVDSSVTNITLPPQWQDSAEQLRKQQARLDRLLKSLDSKLDLMFETLQLNIQKYRSSFSQGLEKMHSLSAESEAMLTELIAQIEQELEQAAASSPESTSSAIPAGETTLASPSASPLSEPAPSRFNQYDADDVPLPYAGFEWRRSTEPPSDRSSNSTETESIKIETNQLSLYGGMGALVAQTDIAPTQKPAESLGSSGKAESADTISTLTDLIENSDLGQSTPQEEDVLEINPVEAQPLGDETNKEELQDSSSLDTDALQESSEDVSSLEQPESPELGESVESLLGQIEADLNLEPIVTTADTADEVVGASTVTAEEEEEEQ